MAGIKEAWAMECDLGNRDPNTLNDHLKVAYEEVLGEPDETRSIDCVWKYSYKCFNMWKTLCYIICTTLCGLCIASCWGCSFACTAFCHIWMFTPCIRCIEIWVSIYKRINTIFCECCVEPFCTSTSKLFSAFSKS